MRIVRLATIVLLAAFGLLVPGLFVASSLAQSSEEIAIRGALPRTPGGTVDLAQVRDAVAARFAQGAREIQFRDFTLNPEETRNLFLNLERNQNLLARIGEAIPADGVERNVTFRGLVDGQRVEGRVQRQEDGTLRARIEGINVGQLSAADRERLIQALSTQAGFARVRLEGVDAAGNRVRTEFRADKGLVKNEVKGVGGGRQEGKLAQGQGDIRQEDRREDRQLNRREDRRDDRQIDRRDDRRVERVQRVERVERVERPQRPERPERPQRPERPERPERMGR